MLLETSTMTACLEDRKKTGELPSPDTLYSLAVAHPEIIFAFRNLKLDDRAGRTRDKLLQIQLRTLTLEPCFSTPYLTDVILDRFYANDVDDNYCANPLPIEVAGVSFLKPDRLYSADLIHNFEGKMVLADGASMIANPSDPNFPPDIKAICTTPSGDFMPDVFWSTAAAEILGKTDFKSPFTAKVKSIVDQTNIREIISPYLNDVLSGPEDLILALNDCFKELYGKAVQTPLNEATRVYFPSGVIGCVDLLLGEWASTGDVRVGYTYSSSGYVQTLNNHQKVNDFDAAALTFNYDQKLEMAKWRANMIGNIQGLPIQIDTGVIPLNLSRSSRLGNRSAVVMWSDGEEIQYPFPDQYDVVDDKYQRYGQLSLSGSLIVRDPILYHLYLLHAQARYKRNLEKNQESNHRTGKSTQLLNRVSRQPKWRNDDASCIVGYFG